MYEYDDNPCPDTGHSQRQNCSLEHARGNSQLGPGGSDVVRSPGLNEGCGFTESLVDADVFGIGYRPLRRYFP